MWFSRFKKSNIEVNEIKAQALDRIDRVTDSIDRNTEQLELLNKALGDRGDVAYNMFVGTGGLRRQQEDLEKGKNK